MARTNKKEKLPKYKRRLRYLCWRLSKAWNVRGKIAKSNQWAIHHKKSFFALVVGSLAFIFIISLLSTFLTSSSDNTLQPSSNGIIPGSEMREIEDIQPMISGYHQIQETNNLVRSEIKNMTEKGLTIHQELDSLLNLENKTHEDSVRIIRDYRLLENIVKFLKKGKE